MTNNIPAADRETSVERPDQAPWRNRWLRALRWILIASAGLAALAAASWWILLTQIVPKIDQWREPLAQQATSTLGVPVKIGRVSGQAQGWWPELTLEDIRLIDAEGRDALRLPRVIVRLSPSSLWPSSLWRRELHVDRLVLSQPQLAVRRDAQGLLHVAGLTLDPHRMQPDGSPAMDWLLDQRLIRIDQGRITWTDELLKAEPLQLSQVDLSLRSRPGLARRIQEWRLSATPPQAFGQRFEARADITQPRWSRQVGQPGEPEPAWWVRWFGQPTRASDWHTWSGQVAVSLPHVDVQSLKRHATLPFDVQGGRGRLAVKAALKQGQPREVLIDADLRAVSLRLARELQPLAFKQIAGQVTALHEPTQTTLSWQALRFTMDDGLTWPASQARLQWQHAAAAAARSGAPPTLLPELQGEVWKRTLKGQFETDHMDLALLAKLADRLPLAAALRQQFDDWAPQGVAEQLTLNWDGPADAPLRYQAQGRLRGLSWQASGQHPGVGGADVEFKATEGGGEAKLAIKDGWAEFPGAFEEPRIPLDTLQAEVNWRITPGKAGQAPAVSLEVPQASFANPDARGSLRATWRTGAGDGVGDGGRYPGVLDLKGTLQQAQGNRVWRYLPASVNTDARHYVRDAVKGGVGENVQFEVRGDLWHFPFKDDQGGKFRIAVPVKDATLDYVPGDKPAPGATAAAPYWPAFQRLNGTLLFEGHGMRIENATATLTDVGSGSFALHKVSGHIDDLGSDHPKLSIQGEGKGPMADLLRFMAVSPLGQWTGQMLDGAQSSGRGNLRLMLDIPLNDVDKTIVQGDVQMAEQDQTSLRLAPQAPWMHGVRGHVQFTQDTLKVDGRAKVWGQEIQIHGSRDAQGVPRFLASGLISAEGMRGATEWPALARVAQRMSGQTPVTVSIALNRARTAGTGAAGNASGFSARPELQVSSTLQGLQLNLPAPLTKPADAAWPLKLVHRADDDDGKTDTLLLDLAGPVTAKAELRRALDGRATPTIQRGLISVTQGQGAAPATSAMPTSGITALVTLPQLDLDAWQALGDQLRRDPATGAMSPPARGHSPMDGYLPDILTLKTGALQWRQRTLKDVALTLSHPAPAVWRAQIEAPQLAGQVEVRPDTAGSVMGPAPGNRVVVRLSRLQVPESEADAFEAQASSNLLADGDTSSVPALDIVIDQFEWRGMALGKLEVDAVNRLIHTPGSPALPEWRMTKFRLGNADAQFSATGNWTALGAQQADAKGKPRHRAAFSFTLDLVNSGALLGRLGMPQTLRGGKGRLSGQVAWLGSPLEPHAASMNGEVKLALNEGQFLKAEPGVAKLLGVLSLQSLPRRLALDFRDVFQSGFAFDRIDGDAQITKGVAQTRNLRMRGVQALVLMEGQADLARETQNLRVFVVPELNAGAASLAYAAINPAIGLGTFIAQVLLRKTVVEATTREFTVTGTWAEPQVERVPRTTVPALATEEPPSQPRSGAGTGDDLKASRTPS
jgi:uncharacterized protein (TIGR02099 family)